MLSKISKKYPNLKLWLYLLISALIPLVIAIHNGYPFYFYDDGGYLTSGFTLIPTPFKPIGYGFILRYLSFSSSLWYVIYFQALAANYLLYRTLSVFFRRNLYYIHFYSLIILSFLTSFGWFVDYLMPDIFIGLGTLAIFIILTDKVKWVEKILLLFLIFVSGISHTSHPPILFATLIISSIYAISTKKLNSHQSLEKLAISAAAILASVFFIIISNSHYNFSYNQASSVFLMGRLEETGILKDFMAKECLSRNYQLCNLLPAFTRIKNDDFLWASNSPLNAVGWDNARSEYQEIVASVFSQPSYILRFTISSLKESAGLLGCLKLDSFGTQIHDRYNTYYSAINKYLPRDLKRLDNSRQLNGDTGWQDHMNIILITVTILSLVIITYAAIRWQLNAKQKLMILITISTVIINALVMATLSSFVDCRYNTRLAWLIPFAALVIVAGRLNTKQNVSR